MEPAVHYHVKSKARIRITYFYPHSSNCSGSGTLPAVQCTWWAVQVWHTACCTWWGVQVWHSACRTWWTVQVWHSAYCTVPGEVCRSGTLPAVPGEVCRSGTLPAVPGELCRSDTLPVVLYLVSCAGHGTLPAVPGELCRSGPLPAVRSKAAAIGLLVASLSGQLGAQEQVGGHCTQHPAQHASHKRALSQPESAKTIFTVENINFIVMLAGLTTSMLRFGTTYSIRKRWQSSVALRVGYRHKGTRVPVQTNGGT